MKLATKEIKQKNKELKSYKLTAEPDFSKTNKIFTNKYTKNNIPGNNTEVNKLIFSQSLPPIIL